MKTPPSTAVSVAWPAGCPWALMKLTVREVPRGAGPPPPPPPISPQALVERAAAAMATSRRAVVVVMPFSRSGGGVGRRECAIRGRARARARPPGRTTEADRLGPAVRIVKGAYLEPPDIAYPKKSDVDENFYRLCVRLLSPEAQQYFATETFEYPVVEGVAISPQITPLEELDAVAADIPLSAMSDLAGTAALLSELGILP